MASPRVPGVRVFPGVGAGEELAACAETGVMNTRGPEPLGRGVRGSSPGVISRHGQPAPCTWRNLQSGREPHGCHVAQVHLQQRHRRRLGREIAELPHGGHALRDSKNPDGPKLIFTPGKWRTFTERIKLTEPK